MDELRDFVLDYYRAHGALIDPPSYGVHEALLPDDLAEELHVPALQQIVFDDVAPDGEDGRLHLAQGHPLVDRLVEKMRREPLAAQAWINAVRLDKRGLAEAARQTLSFANARLAELPQQVETPALYHYLVLTLKVTLNTDEKQEHLITVAMHAQGGWPVEWGAIHERATLEEEPAFAHLEPARPCWIEGPGPLHPAALAGLWERAQRAALARMAGPIESLRRRAARYLELDQARLAHYYDDLTRDLERRLSRAEGDRQAALRDKIAAAQAERELKLADAEARYRLRIDLELVTAQVVAEPKLELLVQIANRNTAIQRRVVWDPLLRAIEPLRCDVCGQPGLSLQLCSGGHLVHAECLLERQCTDCKRVYCRLCQEEMQACAVCGRPVCRTSLNRCGICGRGTCHEHTGLCHAADGAPAAIAPPAAEPEPPKRAAKAKAAPATAQPARPRPARARRPQAPPRPNTANWRIAVETDWTQPVVTAFVLSSRKRGPAIRTWRLSPQGIAVHCDCEKGAACTENHLLMRPEAAQEIEAQLQAEIDRLRREYGVPVRNVSYTLHMHGLPSPQSRLALRGMWRDEALLAEARASFDATYAREHGGSAPGAREGAQPPEEARGSLQPEERAEAERFLQVALGLLRYEGTLKEDDLYQRVHALVLPGGWCTREYFCALLRRNDRLFKVLANGLVATHEVGNVQTLAARKRFHRLPPRRWSVEELLAAGGRWPPPLSEREARIERELRGLGCSEVSVSAVQRALRRGVTEDGVVYDLQGYYGVTEPQARQRVAALIDELAAHTPRWELGGRTPAEVQEGA